MNFLKIVAYVDGLLSDDEKKEVEKFIFTNPIYIEVVSGMNLLRKSLSEGESLSVFLDEKSRKIFTKIKEKGYL